MAYKKAIVHLQQRIIVAYITTNAISVEKCRKMLKMQSKFVSFLRSRTSEEKYSCMSNVSFIPGKIYFVFELVYLLSTVLLI